MKMEIFTSYQCLQSHATLAFGLAASSNVPEVILQMPDAAA
jgi:Na+(H+)/acetate symporter ActP